jgi:hypothetical protein
VVEIAINVIGESNNKAPALLKQNNKALAPTRLSCFFAKFIHFDAVPALAVVQARKIMQLLMAPVLAP